MKNKMPAVQKELAEFALEVDKYTTTHREDGPFVEAAKRLSNEYVLEALFVMDMARKSGRDEQSLVSVTQKVVSEGRMIQT